MAGLEDVAAVSGHQLVDRLQPKLAIEVDQRLIQKPSSTRLIDPD